MVKFFIYLIIAGFGFKLVAYLFGVNVESIAQYAVQIRDLSGGGPVSDLLITVGAGFIMGYSIGYAMGATRNSAKTSHELIKRSIYDI